MMQQQLPTNQPSKWEKLGYLETTTGEEQLLLHTIQNPTTQEFVTNKNKL
jgi:hypothetical protein